VAFATSVLFRCYKKNKTSNRSFAICVERLSIRYSKLTPKLSSKTTLGLLSLHKLNTGEEYRTTALTTISSMLDLLLLLTNI